MYSTKVRSTKVRFYQSHACSKMIFYQIPFYQSPVLPKSGLLKNGILPNSVLPKSVPPLKGPDSSSLSPLPSLNWLPLLCRMGVCSPRKEGQPLDSAATASAGCVRAKQEREEEEGGGCYLGPTHVQPTNQPFTVELPHKLRKRTWLSYFSSAHHRRIY
jgi:hypothetical protein